MLEWIQTVRLIYKFILRDSNLLVRKFAFFVWETMKIFDRWLSYSRANMLHAIDHLNKATLIDAQAHTTNCPATTPTKLLLKTYFRSYSCAQTGIQFHVWKALMDLPIENGGAKWNWTIYQVIYMPYTQELSIKVTLNNQWTTLSLNGVRDQAHIYSTDYVLINTLALTLSTALLG